MIARPTTIALCAVLGWVPVLARPAPAPAEADTPAPEVSPSTAPPAEPPPPPASPDSPAPPAQAQPPGPTGQWVFTQQYGWIWTAYGDAFTYAPPSGYGEPLAYVYYPAAGWTWVAAPWVWGFGPWPYFGVVGPRHFAWYGHGWWRTPARWHLGPARIHGGLAWHGIRSAPLRHERGGHGWGVRHR